MAEIASPTKSNSVRRSSRMKTRRFPLNQVQDWTLINCGNQVIKVETEENDMSQEIDTSQIFVDQYILSTELDATNCTVKLELQDVVEDMIVKLEPVENNPSVEHNSNLSDENDSNSSNENDSNSSDEHDSNSFKERESNLSFEKDPNSSIEHILNKSVECDPDSVEGCSNIREETSGRPNTCEKACQTTGIIVGPLILPSSVVLLNKLHEMSDYYHISSKDLPESVKDQTNTSSKAITTNNVADKDSLVLLPRNSKQPVIRRNNTVASSVITSKDLTVPMPKNFKKLVTRGKNVILSNDTVADSVIMNKESPVLTPKNSNQPIHVTRSKNILLNKNTTPHIVVLEKNSIPTPKVFKQSVKCNKRMTLKERKGSPESANVQFSPASSIITNNFVAGSVVHVMEKDTPVPTPEQPWTCNKKGTLKRRIQKKSISDRAYSPLYTVELPESSDEEQENLNVNKKMLRNKSTNRFPKKSDPSECLTSVPKLPDKVVILKIRKELSMDSLYNEEKRKKRRKIPRKLTNAHLTCRICNNVFDTAINLRRHSRCHGPPSICSICGNKFTMKHGLKQHISVVHRGERLHKCSLCDKAFSRSDALKLHLDVTHHTEKPHHCTVCNQNFSFTKEFRDHLNSHLGKKLYICTVCARSFQSSMLLKKHTWKMHSTDECNLCGKVFNSIEENKSHRLTHLEQKVCDICNASFPRTSQLKDHIRRNHTKELPYKCVTCGKAFASNGEMNRHKAIHSDIKQHLCDICGNTFRRPDTLKIHRKLVHGIFPVRQQIRHSF